MTAEDIMSFNADRETQCKTVWNCDCAIYFTTDLRDWRESGVLYEDTLRAQDIMREVTK